MTFDALNYSWIVFLVAAEGIIYDRDWYQWNQTIVYIVRCVYHIALAGLGCQSIPDMTYIYTFRGVSRTSDVARPV